jgi:hypothetical protein
MCKYTFLKGPFYLYHLKSSIVFQLYQQCLESLAKYETFIHKKHLAMQRTNRDTQRPCSHLCNMLYLCKLQHVSEYRVSVGSVTAQSLY